MPTYLYRIDPLAEFRKIRDGVFRAKRYRRGGYPHRLLINQLDLAPNNHAIYRICFYSNMQITERSLRLDFASVGPCVTHGIDAERLLAAGFTHAWDDGFNEGDASMFWILEELDGTNESFSRAGVEVSLFEPVVF